MWNRYRSIQPRYTCREHPGLGNTVIGTAPAAGQLFPPAGSYIGQIVVATDGPFAEISNTQVVGNNLDGSELPGIVVHSNVFGDVITQTLIQDNMIADNGYYPGPPATKPNGPGVSQGTTGIALIAEVGGTDYSIIQCFHIRM